MIKKFRLSLFFFFLILLTVGSFSENKASLIYSTYLGGEGYEDSDCPGIAVDAEGNIYVTGTTDSSDFPTTPGAYDTTYNGKGDVFVIKFDPAGRNIIYSTFLGGSSGDSSLGIAVDAEGNVYITGDTNSFDFPTTPNAYDTTFNGSTDVFVTKINSTGTELIYSTYLGGVDPERSTDIAVDTDGNVYITGITGSFDFPVTFGSYDTILNGSADAFIVKLNSTGTELVYSTFLGGSATYLEGIDPSVDIGQGIAVDVDGNAYVTGITYSNDFPTTPGAYSTAYKASADVFVTKINSTGTGLVYSTFLGGWGADLGRGIVVDANGDAYVTGFASVGFPTTFGAYNTSHNGSWDAFITKVNSTGTGLVYSTYLGGSEHDYGFAIEIDENGNAYIVGHTFSTFSGYPNDFPTTLGAYDTSYNGDADIFVAKINSTGKELSYSTYLGGSDQDSSGENQGIAVDAEGGVYVTGNTQSIDFPTTPDAYDVTYNGNGDVFVTKLLISVGLNIFTTFGGTTDPEPGTYVYEEGAEVAVKAVPSSGYRFSNWTGDVPAGWEISNPLTILMDSDKAVTANFVRQYRLTITSEDGGTTDPAPGTYTYDSGTQVSITAIPSVGYQFSEWSGVASGKDDNPITVVMRSDKSITAHFKSGCFIATAVYGSPLHPHVQALRDFRDRYLMTSKIGHKIVKLYYRYSPFIADLIRKNEALKIVVRIGLLLLIVFSSLTVQ